MSALSQGQFWTPRPLERAWGQKVVENIPEPAKGAQWKYTIPPQYLTRVLAIAIPFTTAAEAAKRFPGIKILDPTGRVLCEYNSATEQSEGLTRTANYLADASLGTGISNNMPIIWLPPWVLEPEYVLEGRTTGMTANDQYGKGVVLTEQYEPNPDHPIAEARIEARAMEILQLAVQLASA